MVRRRCPATSMMRMGFAGGRGDRMASEIGRIRHPTPCHGALNRRMGLPDVSGARRPRLKARRCGPGAQCELTVPRALCGRGGTGRRAGLKIRFRKECRFDSDRPHHLSILCGEIGRVSAQSVDAGWRDVAVQGSPATWIPHIPSETSPDFATPGSPVERSRPIPPAAPGVGSRIHPPPGRETTPPFHRQSALRSPSPFAGPARPRTADTSDAESGPHAPTYPQPGGHPIARSPERAVRRDAGSLASSS